MQKYTKQQEFEYEIQRFRELLRNSEEITKLSQTQELIARTKGYKNWHDFQVINRQQIEYVNAFHCYDYKILSQWNKMLSQEDIQTVDIIPRKTKKTLIYKEIIPFELPVFFKKTKKLWSTKTEEISLQPKDFPMLILGSTGAGKLELQNTMAKEIILRNKGYIFIDGCGYSETQASQLMYWAKQTDREKDFLWMNFLTGGNKKNHLSNTINPLDMLLLNQKSFYKTFGEEISKWLFPAIKSYESKGKKVKITSIEAFLKLPQLLLMANSDEWDNRKEVIEYLQLIDMPINGDLPDESIKDASVRHTINCAKALQVTNLFNIYEDCVFSDYPEFSFDDVFKDNKILLITLPSLEKSVDEFGLLKNILHEMLINADEMYGSKENFIGFFENANNVKFKSNAFYFSFDTYGYSKELFNFLSFYDAGRVKDISFNKWELSYSDVDFQSYYLMKQEDPDGINFIRDFLFQRYWLYEGLDSLYHIKNKQIKELSEGQGYFISKNEDNKTFSAEFYFFKFTPLQINKLFFSKENL